MLSYGYNKEAISFYETVLEQYPNNNYLKYNIFVNSKFNKKNNKNLKKVFYDNLVLINLFPNNHILHNNFYNLSKKLEYREWISFFEIILFKKDSLNNNLNELYKLTEDYNLKKIINIYI